MYRQLKYALRGGVKQIAGYLCLLEVFLRPFDIYEHFPTLHPPHNMGYTNDMSWSFMWEMRGLASASLKNLQTICGSLVYLRAHEVSYFYKKLQFFWNDKYINITRFQL